MYITNVTNYESITDYDNITSLNDSSTLCNCTKNDNNEINVEISNTTIYHNPMWNVTYMFNMSYGIYIIQTINQ